MDMIWGGEGAGGRDWNIWIYEFPNSSAWRYDMGLGGRNWSIEGTSVIDKGNNCFMVLKQ